MLKPPSNKHTCNYMGVSEKNCLYMVINTTVYTLKPISNWPSHSCYILGKVFGEKYK